MMFAITASSLRSLFHKVWECVHGNFDCSSQRSDTDTDLLDENVWLAFSTRIHPKHVLLGWGQDSVLANQVLPHQCVFRLCALLCSPVGTVRFVGGVKLPKISRYGEVLRVWLQLRGWAQVLFNSNTLFLRSSESHVYSDWLWESCTLCI